MRSDMSKIIVERPRFGGRLTSFPPRHRPDCARLPMEDWISRQSIRRAWAHDRKHLNENLAPLRRFLQSRLGHQWDDVYSEICQHINRDSAVQLHIWQHLMEYVCTDPYVALGLVNRRWFAPEFIVDSKTGALRVNPRRLRPRRSAPKENPDRVSVNDQQEYRRINGVWYELELCRLWNSCVAYDYGIMRSVAEISDDERQKFYGQQVFASSKRQLNKKEIRRLRLAPKP